MGKSPKGADVGSTSIDDIDAGEAIELVSEMIGTPSPTGGEETLARKIAAWATERGLRARLQPIGTGRANVIIKLDGSGKGPSLLLNGHMDTSSRGDEDHLRGLGYQPKAVIRDGWLMGLGAVNMKSGLAAALMALHTIAREKERPAGDIYVAGVAGEIEKACIDEFQGPDYTGYGFGTKCLLSHGVTADFGLVCEPTDFMPSRGQLGALWMKITLRGDMRHTTFFDEASGDHAIYKAVKVVEAIRMWGREYQHRNAYEGQLAQVHVGAIRGGWPWRISRTPQDCSLYIDIRLNPLQRPEAVLQEVRNVVRSSLADLAAEHLVEIHPYVIAPSVVAAGDEAIFDIVRKAHAEAFGRAAKMLFRGPMADSGHMNAAGIPTVTYGLGPAGNFDRVNEATGESGEQIRLEDYLTLISIYTKVARSLNAAT